VAKAQRLQKYRKIDEPSEEKFINQTFHHSDWPEIYIKLSTYKNIIYFNPKSDWEVINIKFLLLFRLKYLYYLTQVLLLSKIKRTFSCKKSNKIARPKYSYLKKKPTNSPFWPFYQRFVMLTLYKCAFRSSEGFCLKNFEANKDWFPGCFFIRF